MSKSDLITPTIDQRVADNAGRDIPLSSSWIRSCRYDDDTQALTVNMTSNTYDLTGVPPDVFLDFIDAPSAGTYFNDNLKGKY